MNVLTRPCWVQWGWRLGRSWASGEARLPRGAGCGSVPWPAPWPAPGEDPLAVLGPPEWEDTCPTAAGLCSLADPLLSQTPGTFQL